MKEPIQRPLWVGKTFKRIPYRFVIAGLILLAHLSIGLNFFVVSPLLPLIIEEYEITRATAGLLIALPLLIAAAFGLPGGAVIGRVGLRRGFGSAWLLVGLMVLSSWATNFPTLLALRLGYGVGFAVILTATGPLLMQWFPPKEVLIMNSLNTAVISLGIALSVSTAAPIASLMGWQNALGLFGAVGLVGAAGWALFGRTSDAGEKGGSPHVPLNGIIAVLKSRAILLLVAADAGVLIQYTALTSWLPTFYSETRGFSLSQAGFITGLLPLVGVVAVLLGGFLPSRLGTKRLIFTAPGVIVILGGSGLLFVRRFANYSHVSHFAWDRIMVVCSSTPIFAHENEGDDAGKSRDSLGDLCDRGWNRNVCCSPFGRNPKGHFRNIFARISYLRRSRLVVTGSRCLPAQG